MRHMVGTSGAMVMRSSASPCRKACGSKRRWNTSRVPRQVKGMTVLHQPPNERADADQHRIVGVDAAIDLAAGRDRAQAWRHGCARRLSAVRSSPMTARSPPDRRGFLVERRRQQSHSSRKFGQRHKARPRQFVRQATARARRIPRRTGPAWLRATQWSRPSARAFRADAGWSQSRRAGSRRTRRACATRSGGSGTPPCRRPKDPAPAGRRRDARTFQRLRAVRARISASARKGLWLRSLAAAAKLSPNVAGDNDLGAGWPAAFISLAALSRDNCG